MSRLALVLIVVTLGFQGLVAYKLFWTTRADATESIRAASPDSIIDISGMSSTGSDSARVAFVEFFDFECPFCKQHAESVQEQLIEPL